MLIKIFHIGFEVNSSGSIHESLCTILKLVFECSFLQISIIKTSNIIFMHVKVLIRFLHSFVPLMFYSFCTRLFFWNQIFVCYRKFWVNLASLSTGFDCWQITCGFMSEINSHICISIHYLPLSPRSGLWDSRLSRDPHTSLTLFQGRESRHEEST